MGAVGSILFGNRRKKLDEDQPRRDPLTTIGEMLKSDEARARIIEEVKSHPPGTVFRWDKLLKSCNRDLVLTEERPDPIRLVMDMDMLKSILRTFYFDLEVKQSDGLGLMKQFLPKMYEKHSFERGRRVSQKERDEKNMQDDCYAYGELAPDAFASIYSKVTSAYGEREKGIFYDLGCGVGNLVYAAAFIGNFAKVSGIDNVQSLLDRGEKRGIKWEKIKEFLPVKTREIDIEWTHDNFIDAEYWVEATFVLLHWTTFTLEQRYKIADSMTRCREGTIVIAFTHPIPNPDFEILVKDTCEVSWGKSDFYVQEKQTPPKKTYS